MGKQKNKQKVYDNAPVRQDEVWEGAPNVKPATYNQQTYWIELGLKLRKDSQITIAAGAAGAGKTWLACAKAAQLYSEGSIRKIIITRPMIPVMGGMDGALPGGKDEKFDPWIGNVKSMLSEFLSPGTVNAEWGNSIIAEPLDFCRGKTFNGSFIIVDEAQNLVWDQVKMITTRVGKWSKMVLAGDTSQVDLPDKFPNGLERLLKEIRVQNMPLEVIRFDSTDNQRSGISRLMVECFDKAV